MKFRYVFLLAVLLSLVVVPGALAAATGDTAPQPDGPVQLGVNLYLLALGALVPLVGYVLNHYAPWASEPVKGIVQAALAAAVAVLYQAVTPGDLGLNDQTFAAVVTAIVGSLGGHIGWAKGRINIALGGGTNKDGTISDPKVQPVEPPGVEVG